MNATIFGTSLKDVSLLAGCWILARISVDTSDVRSCPVAEACIGGADHSEYCREGHDGPYCNLCEVGNSKDVFGICQECQTSTANIVGTVMTFIGLAALTFAVSFIQKKLKRTREWRRRLRQLQAG